MPGKLIFTLRGYIATERFAIFAEMHSAFLQSLSWPNLRKYYILLMSIERKVGCDLTAKERIIALRLLEKVNAVPHIAKEIGLEQVPNKGIRSSNDNICKGVIV